MNEIVDPGRVDLRFAKAYIPICILFSEIVGVSVLVLCSKLPATESWTLVMIIVWLLERVVVEEVLKYNSLLETTVLTSLLNHYRVIRNGKGSTFEARAGSALWFTCFIGINITMSISRGGARRSHHPRIETWACILLLVAYSVYTPMNDDVVASDVIKAFLFLVLSVAWVYLCDHKALRYDRLHDCEECKLRFLPILFTPMAFSVPMALVFVLGIAYIAFIHKKWTGGADVKNNDKDAEKGDVAPDTALHTEEEDREIFKLAMQSRNSDLKNA